ncbi:MAG: hypothetical protein WC333_04495 [Dehalococcoidia bacterium]
MDTITNKRIETLLEWKGQIEKELIDNKRKYAELGDELSRKENQLRNVLSLLAIEGWTNCEQGKTVKLSNILIENTYAAMKEIGKPIYYRELAIKMKETGVAIPGTDPAANLLAHMNRDERFHRIARGTYALIEWNLPKLRKGGNSTKRKSRAKTKRSSRRRA